MKRGLAGAAVVAAGVAATTMVVKGRAPAVRPENGTFVNVGDARMFVDDRGNGPALILIHGLGCSTFSFRLIHDGLARCRRVVAVDLPGWGWSDRNPGIPLDHNAQADRISAVVDHLGIDSATVLGHSMGGAIAQRFAVRHPGKIKGLVLLSAVDANNRSRWERGERRAGPFVRAIHVSSKVSPFVYRLGMRLGLRSMMANTSAATAEMAAGYAEPLARPGTRECLAAMFRDVSHQLPCDLSQITSPTLVLSGAEDRVVTPSEGRRIAAQISSSRHVVVEGIGHFGMEEQPQRIIDEVEGFLAQLET